MIFTGKEAEFVGKTLLELFAGGEVNLSGQSEGVIGYFERMADRGKAAIDKKENGDIVVSGKPYFIDRVNHLVGLTKR